MTKKTEWNGLAARLHRTLRGWTLDDVAAKLRDHGVTVNPSTVWRWEGGTEPSSSEQIGALAKVLGCSRRAFYHEPTITWRKE